MNIVIAVFDERERLSKKKEDEYVREKLSDRFGNVTIDSFKVNHIDLVDMPLAIDVHYHVPGYAQIADNMVYLCPVLIHRRESNPFTREIRNFPVEYNYTLTSSENVEITIPEGYQVVEKVRGILICLRSYFNSDSSGQQSDKSNSIVARRC